MIVKNINFFNSNLYLIYLPKMHWSTNFTLFTHLLVNLLDFDVNLRVRAAS